MAGTGVGKIGASEQTGAFAYALLIGYSATVLIVAGLMFSSFILGPLSIFFGSPEAVGVGRMVGPLPIFFFGIQLFVLPPSIPLVDAFLGLWIVLLIFYVLGVLSPTSIFRVMGRIDVRGGKALLENTLLVVIASFSALIVSLEGIEFVQTSVGIPTGDPAIGDPFLKITLLSYAAIAEELGFRVGIIGVIALSLLVSFRAGPRSLMVLWHPNKYLRRFLNDIQYRYASKVTWIMVIISAILFGGGHVLYGSGWEIGKVSLATLSGLVLGWIYVRSGLVGAVLLHWSFNYFIASYRNFADAFASDFIFQFMYTIILLSGVFTLVLVLGAAFRVKRIKPLQF